MNELSLSPERAVILSSGGEPQHSTPLVLACPLSSHRSLSPLPRSPVYLSMASKMLASSTSRAAGVLPARIGIPNQLRAQAPMRSSRVGRQMVLDVLAAVKYDYDTKVFQKELVQFADTDEYIYRWVFVSLGGMGARHRVHFNTTTNCLAH
jgi:hypothetical protein